MREIKINIACALYWYDLSRKGAEGDKRKNKICQPMIQKNNRKRKEMSVRSASVRLIESALIKIHSVFTCGEEAISHYQLR